DFFLSKLLGNSKDEIGCGRACGQSAVQLETDNFRNQHRYRLSEHCGFRFDATHAPAEYAESVDHCRVRIGSNEGVGICDCLTILLACEHHLSEVLEIDLVDDSGSRRNDAEILERFLSPPEKRVALLIALEFFSGVDEK